MTFELDNLRERLLFVDILKVIGISLVTYHHVSQYYPFLARYALNVNLWNMYEFDWGKVGVLIFLFASGVALAVTHLDISSFKEVKEFYGKRLLRIFPAYYVAIVFSIVAEPNILHQSFAAADYVKMLFGMQALGAHTIWDIYGKVNGPFWFLTPLILLYLVFPLLAYAIKNRPHHSILVIFAVNEVCLFIFSKSTVFFGANWWFPLCLIFYFSFGIYIVRLGLFPKIVSKNVVIVYLSNISFYMYLINEPLYVNLGNYLPFFLVALMICSSLLYRFDMSIIAFISRVKAKIAIDIHLVRDG
jgi:peptidoglycan/LPS O-acetylase OafA/YrhL